MSLEHTRSAGAGLERSCQPPAASWIASTGPTDGVELFRAWLVGEAYDKHRHDTYAIGLTDWGVQVFDYRGAVRASTPGQVVVLYPDEAHDGRAGTDEGFGYRIVYVEPSHLAEALRSSAGGPTRCRSCANPCRRTRGCRKPSSEPFGPHWNRWRWIASLSTWRED